MTLALKLQHGNLKPGKPYIQASGILPYTFSEALM